MLHPGARYGPNRARPRVRTIARRSHAFALRAKREPRGTLAFAGGFRRPLFTQDAEPQEIDASTSLDCTFAERALVGKAQRRASFGTTGLSGVVVISTRSRSRFSNAHDTASEVERVPTPRCRTSGTSQKPTSQRRSFQSKRWRIMDPQKSPVPGSAPPISLAPHAPRGYRFAWKPAVRSEQPGLAPSGDSSALVACLAPTYGVLDG
jgi:hypothetical protein